MRFEVVPAKHYHNTVTQAVASIHGEPPYASDAEQANWEIKNSGWTIRDNQNAAAGFELAKPFAVEAEAAQIASEMESAAAAAVLRHWLPRSFPGKAFTILLNMRGPTGVTVTWRHAARPGDVTDAAATILESAGLGMTATKPTSDGVFAKFTLVPSDALSAYIEETAANDGVAANAA